MWDRRRAPRGARGLKPYKEAKDEEDEKRRAPRGARGLKHVRRRYRPGRARRAPRGARGLKHEGVVVFFGRVD